MSEHGLQATRDAIDWSSRIRSRPVDNFVRVTIDVGPFEDSTGRGTQPSEKQRKFREVWPAGQRLDRHDRVVVGLAHCTGAMG